MDKGYKKQNKINSKPIISVLIGLTLFSLILIITMLSAAEDTKPKVGGPQPAKIKEIESKQEETSEPYDIEMLAIVKEIDTIGLRITLFDINREEEKSLYYTGATDIKDKYDQVIAISQLDIGEMVDVGYRSKDRKLMKLQESTKTWEYINVTNLSIDRIDQVMKIARTKYKYTDDLVILDDGNYITVNDLAEQDELILGGYDQTIWTIMVTKGHGSVSLTGQEAFLGGSITVGYEAMQQVTEDLRLTVREGNFNLTVENGVYSGTKNITVYRNKETVVNLSELGPEAVQHGRVTFDITPFGADLFIDGELTPYANPIELSYGEHTTEVSLGGYTDYTGTILVDTAGKKIKVNLPEASTSKPVDVTVITGSNTPGTEPSEGEIQDEDEDDGQEYNEWNYPGEEIGDDFDEEPTEEYIIDEEHLIYVQYPVGASVYLNGDFMGTSPGSFQKVIGSHVITFIREGYETKSYTIETADDGLDTYLSLPELIQE
ncbi:MAG TPA: PEGA domain-containing protein [Mobilitalea sp.]|nr:PEGA domain-containing protein [Mobilitalea sp.]